MTQQTITPPDSWAARFCGRLIHERDLLDTARGRDERSPRKQRGPWERTRVGRLLARLQPRSGFGTGETLYQRALAEATQRGLSDLRPLLAAAWDAHKTLLSESRAGRTSGGTMQLHGNTLQAVIDYLPAVGPTPATPNTPPVAAAKSESGQPIAATLDESPADDSAWVPASTLWPTRFKTRKILDKFRRQHPAMFRNPSPYKLTIHAAQWACYWADHDKAGFDSLGESAPSIADDPDIQEDALASALDRMAKLREKKRRKR